MSQTHPQRSFPSHPPSLYPCLLPLCMSYLVLSSLATARLVNITVDDTNPDPLTGASFTYSPANSWSLGNGCEPCTAKPDPSKVYDATWQDATYNPGSIMADWEVQTANFPFNGTAFYVYGVLGQSSTSPRSFADITFFIDGQPAGNFQYTPPGIPDSYVYNYLLWYTDSLPLGQHTFALQNGRPGGDISLILLDYVIYTRDDGISEPPGPTSTPSSPPVIVTGLPAVILTGLVPEGAGPSSSSSSSITSMLSPISSATSTVTVTDTGGLSSGTESALSGMNGTTGPASSSKTVEMSSPTIAIAATGGSSPTTNTGDHERGGSSRVIIIIAVATTIGFIAFIAISYLLYKLCCRPGEVVAAVTPFISGERGDVGLHLAKDDDRPPAYNSLENYESRRL